MYTTWLICMPAPILLLYTTVAVDTLKIHSGEIFSA